MLDTAWKKITARGKFRHGGVSKGGEEHGAQWKRPPRLIEKGRRINQEKRECLQRAFKAGVKVAYGTDAGVFPHGENAADFRYMVEFGLSPVQAIQCATIHAADLL